MGYKCGRAISLADRASRQEQRRLTEILPDQSTSGPDRNECTQGDTQHARDHGGGSHNGAPFRTDPRCSQGNVPIATRGLKLGKTPALEAGFVPGQVGAAVARPKRSKYSDVIHSNRDKIFSACGPNPLLAQSQNSRRSSSGRWRKTPCRDPAGARAVPTSSSSDEDFAIGQRPA